MTSFTVSVNFVWLLIRGGFTTEFDLVTSPNTVMIVELGKKNTSQLLITVYCQFIAVHQLLLLIKMDRIINLGVGKELQQSVCVCVCVCVCSLIILELMLCFPSC